MDQPVLVRTKNYLNLDDETLDERRDELRLSDPPADANWPSSTLGGYMNVDTQTSFPIDEEDENVEDEQQQQHPQPADTNEQATQSSLGNQAQQIHPVHEEADQPMMDEQQKIGLLRALLAAERHKSQQRRSNYVHLQSHLNQLQADYLRLQRDLVEALELGHKIKAQKEAQIEAVDETLREKDKLIEQLRLTIDSLDETKLRDEFKQLTSKQNELHELEKQQLREQVMAVEQQLVRERVNNSQTLQQFQTKLEQQLSRHEQEEAKLRSRVAQVEGDYDKLVGEPQNLVIKELKEENIRFACQVDELQVLLDESQVKYDSLRRRMESMLAEQKQVEDRDHSELERVQLQCAEQRQTLGQLRSELDDRDELLQANQFNLQRSERRVKGLLASLKGKECTYKEMIEQLEGKHEKQLEKTNNALRVLERKLIEQQAELERKQNDIVRLQLEHENQLESLRTDRDERLNKLLLERQKLDKELKGTEVRLAREVEDKELKTKTIEQLQKEVGQFKEESKRLSIELTKSEAKLFNKQRELSQLMRDRLGANLTDQQQHALEFELDESKRHSRRLEQTIIELRSENERICMKLKVNEANMSKVDEAIKGEHARLLQEYERKMGQIKAEQGAYERNRLRYKRYGHKLKRYCEHLCRIHEHVCNPTACGYSISGQLESADQLAEAPTSNWDSVDLLQSHPRAASVCPSSEEDAHQLDVSSELHEQRENINYCSTPNRHYQRRRRDRFSIKRTGLSPSIVKSAPPGKRELNQPLGNSTNKLASQPKSTSSADQLYSEIDTVTSDQHKYYYINQEDVKSTLGRSDKTQSGARRRIL